VSFTKAIIGVEIIPLLIALVALVIFTKYRKQILAAVVVSPVPPIP
jgi:hypothetical protein